MNDMITTREWIDASHEVRNLEVLNEKHPGDDGIKSRLNKARKRVEDLELERKAKEEVG